MEYVEVLKELRETCRCLSSPAQTTRSIPTSHLAGGAGAPGSLSPPYPELFRQGGAPKSGVPTGPPKPRHIEIRFRVLLLPYIFQESPITTTSSHCFQDFVHRFYGVLLDGENILNGRSLAGEKRSPREVLAGKVSYLNMQ